MEYVEEGEMPKGLSPCWVVCPYCGARFNVWRTAFHAWSEKLPITCPNPDCGKVYYLTKGGACLVAVQE